MLGLVCAAWAFLAAPPRLPALSGGDADAWRFESLSLQEGAELITTLSRTYTTRQPDFPCNPLTPNSVPQGFLGFAYKEDVRMVLHFYESTPGVASISAVCVAQDDFEAGPALMRRVRRQDHLEFDPACLARQPRYRLMDANFDDFYD